MRFYISQTIGTGEPDVDPFRPATDNYIQTRRMVDMRKNVTASGNIFVGCSPTEQQHTDMKADLLITYIPIEGIGGAELGVNDVLSQIPEAKRNALIAALEARQVPLDGLTGTSTIKLLLKRIVLRLLIRGILKDIDIDDGLDLDINTTKRDAIKARLAELDITGTTKTIARELIKEIYSINNKFLKTQYN